MCDAKGRKGRGQQVFNHSLLALARTLSQSPTFFASHTYMHRVFFSSLLWAYLCIKFIGRNKHICVISRKFLTHLSLGSNAGDFHKTSTHCLECVCACECVCVSVSVCNCWPPLLLLLKCVTDKIYQVITDVSDNP